jgi:hypothetical protein
MTSLRFLNSSGRTGKRNRSRAGGAGMRASRLGIVDRHRRCRRGAGDRDAAVPVGHRTGAERHHVRRCARTYRRAAHRRLVGGRPHRHRRPDHAHGALRTHQRKARPDARGKGIRSVVTYRHYEPARSPRAGAAAVRLAARPRPWRCGSRSRPSAAGTERHTV